MSVTKEDLHLLSMLLLISSSHLLLAVRNHRRQLGPAGRDLHQTGDNQPHVDQVDKIRVNSDIFIWIEKYLF